MKKFANKKLWSGLTAVALVMALTVTALAAWPSFQNDATNNGVIAAPPGIDPPIASGTTPTTVSLTNNGAQYSGVDTATVISSGGVAYTLYNGGSVSGTTGGARLQATNMSNASTLWNIQISSTSPTVTDSFILSTPYLDEPSNTLYLATTWHSPDYSTYGWEYWMVTNVSGTPSTPQQLGSGDGQANTPISGYVNPSSGALQYIFFGTYTDSLSGQYRRYDAGSSTYVTALVKDDFYWAGATFVRINNTDYVVFGGDSSAVYSVPVATFGTVRPNMLVLNPVKGIAPGKVRSSIVQASGVPEFVFFTSQGVADSVGVLWQVAFSDLLGISTSNGVPLQGVNGKGQTTSTPAISDYGIVYVGTYCTDPETFKPVSGTVEAYGASLYSTVPPDYFKTIYSGDDGVQSSIIVWTPPTGYRDYIYFTTNVDHTQDTPSTANHNGYCYWYNIVDRTYAPVWNPAYAGGSYALQGFAYDSVTGSVVFGDDSDTLYIFKP
jgi:hypothetical protein